MSCSCITQRCQPFLSPPFSPAAPGLWSALSCRPKRLPPWPPCRGEAVAEDSRLGDWAIMGELGVEVRAPVSVRRCSSLCLCCWSIWHTTTCCSGVKFCDVRNCWSCCCCCCCSRKSCFCCSDRREDLKHTHQHASHARPYTSTLP